jgi:tRNA A37 threonylcarbamoyladenosine synthetase subunit TsaC/SUA5/YrdC
MTTTLRAIDAAEIMPAAERVFATIRSGGIAIIPLDVAYAIVGHGEDAVRRMFAAKQRSFTKANGMFGSFALMREILHLLPRHTDMVRAVVQDHDLPMSVVAAYRADHPMVAALAPFVLERSTQSDTMDMLLNAGALHNAMTRLALEHQYAIVGSSANASLTGSKFTLDEVDDQVKAVGDILVDGGRCKYANPERISSTIVRFPDLTVLRFGCCYEQIRGIFTREFAVDLPPKPVPKSAP